MRRRVRIRRETLLPSPNSNWDWNLRLRISDSAKTRPQSRFQGLDYGRDLIIRGQMRAPRELRGRTIKVILSPFGPKVRFGRGGLLQVGVLKTSPEGANFDFEASLMLPEDAIAPTITTLASTWKHLQIQTGDDDLHAARIFAYSFHADIPPNFKGWADAD
jgi:hypothetical protein